MKTPCKGCNERAVGCHVACARYIESVEEMHMVREREREHRMCEKAAIMRSIKQRDNAESIKKCAGDGEKL